MYLYIQADTGSVSFSSTKLKACPARQPQKQLHPFAPQLLTRGGLWG